MRLTFLTGIWPPDIGGPATHGPAFARFLVSRGHEVVVVTMGDGEPTVRPCEVVVIPRSRPFPVRYSSVAVVAARRARRSNVLYATATYAAAAAASVAARRPLAVKLVSDPAYERAQRYGLFDGSLEEFQLPAGRRVESLKAARTRALRGARAIVVPSAYLARIAAAWGLDEGRITVLHNPAPEIESTTTPTTPGAFVFVGRLTRQKDLDIAIDAVARVPKAHLTIVGDGPDRARLEERAAASPGRERISFRGALPRAEAIAVLAGADACVISSAWENFPHAAVEALAVGVPVVATAVGGVPEIVHDGENGLLVPAGSADALAVALRRVVDENGLRGRLAGAARRSVEPLTAERVYGRLEAILAEVARAR
jgi:glycosyltransferase involved in cell wall biosynthesis